MQVSPDKPIEAGVVEAANNTLGTATKALLGQSRLPRTPSTPVNANDPKVSSFSSKLFGGFKSALKFGLGGAAMLTAAALAAPLLGFAGGMAATYGVLAGIVIGGAGAVNSMKEKTESFGDGMKLGMGGTLLHFGGQVMLDLVGFGVKCFESAVKNTDITQPTKTESAILHWGDNKLHLI